MGLAGTSDWRVALVQPLGANDHYQQDKLNVRRIEQQKDWFCGAACSVMFTEFFNVVWDQVGAYSRIHDRQRFQVERLYSDPKGIADFLNSALAGQLAAPIADSNPVDAKSALDAILRCIRYLKFPAICLTHNGDHWIVVDGIRYVERIDGSKDYIGVYAQNPWYNLSPNLYIDIDEFIANWITPNTWGVQWLNRRVIMSDGNTVALAGNRIASLGMRQIPVRLADLGGGAFHIDPTSLALNALRSQGFNSIRPIAGGGAPVREPVRVLEAGSDRYYWIVALDATGVPEFEDFVYAAISEDGQRLFEVAQLARQLNIPTLEEAKLDLGNSNPGKTVVVEPQVKWARRFVTPSRFDVYYDATVDGAAIYYLRTGRSVSSLDMPRTGGG